MKALLQAGGLGTRLKPFTTTIPKPLMPIGERAIMEILLGQLQRAGINEIVVAVGYLSHLIKAYVGDGSRFGVNIEYVEETRPLGTAGSIGLAMDKLGEDFLLLNGDLLTTLNFAEMIQVHHKEKAAATIGTYQREVRIDFGVLDLNDKNQLTKYTEKPTIKYFVSMGVYVLNKKSITPYVNPIRRIDAPTLMECLLNDKQSIFCHRPDCYWLDIGRPDDYALANDLSANGTFNFEA
jgi:NDP-sugar pyrophosphorylase family protein